MRYAKDKSILSAKNGMNLYRDRSHGRIYCDSRSDGYNMKHDFEDVGIKENAAGLLDPALKRKQEKSVTGAGSMSDPCIHWN